MSLLTDMEIDNQSIIEGDGDAVRIYKKSTATWFSIIGLVNWISFMVDPGTGSEVSVSNSTVTFNLTSIEDAGLTITDFISEYNQNDLRIMLPYRGIEKACKIYDVLPDRHVEITLILELL